MEKRLFSGLEKRLLFQEKYYPFHRSTKPRGRKYSSVKEKRRDSVFGERLKFCRFIGSAFPRLYARVFSLLFQLFPDTLQITPGIITFTPGARAECRFNFDIPRRLKNTRWQKKRSHCSLQLPGKHNSSQQFFTLAIENNLILL